MSATQTFLRIPVSEGEFQVLSAQAKASNMEVEEFISRRLPQIQKTNSEKPIVITDTERQRIEKLVGKNISTGEELIQVVAHALAVTLDGITVELTPFLLDRLKTRSLGMPFEKFIPMIVKRLLEEHAGIR